MYTISKETYEYMKKISGELHGQPEQKAGKLVPSKLTNRLMWTSTDVPDPVGELCSNAAMGPMLFSSQSQSMNSPDSNCTTDSVQSFASSSSFHSGPEQVVPTDCGITTNHHDTERLSQLWETLRSIKDDCDYCRKLAVHRHRFPKHTLYAEDTGALTCPLVLQSTCSVCHRPGHTHDFCNVPVQSETAKAEPRNVPQRRRIVGRNHRKY